MTYELEARVWRAKLLEAGITVEAVLSPDYKYQQLDWKDSPLGWGVRSVAANPYWCGPLYTNLEDLPPLWAQLVLPKLEAINGQ